MGDNSVDSVVALALTNLTKKDGVPFLATEKTRTSIIVAR